MYVYRKYPQTCPSTMIKSTKFFPFAIVFLQPFCPFSFFFFFPIFFPSSLFFSFFVLYTMVFLPFPPSMCGSGVGSSFSLLPLLLLEPSILSCKAACSLFRHHLYINAARELAGQHLMRGNSTPRYLFYLILILYLIFSHPLCCKVCLRRYIKRLISLLATLDRCSEVVVVLGHGYILHRYSLPLFRV